nr:C25 family cysteine peptidase [Flavipsychrobacter sp.]
MNRIKQAFTIITLLATSFMLKAQTGNEWIDYSKTYWKIKVGREGIYRITLSALQGMPSSVNGANFILYRDGQEVPVYTTTNSTFGSTDYIEFYGTKQDGKLDKLLYENPRFQPNDRISLFADTAVYFLTYDNQSNHLRYAQTPNNIPGTPPAPLSFCLATTGNYFLRNFSQGNNVVDGQHIPASYFDNGEGYVDTLVNINTPLTYSLSTPNVVAAPVNATFNSSVIRSSYYYATDQIKVLLNNQQIADSALPVDATQHFNVSVPSSLIAANNNIQFVATTQGTNSNEYGVSYIEIQYPRDFNLNNISSFAFGLPASSTSQYMEFSNFSTGSNAPKLYDLTNRKWYAGDLSVAGKVRYNVDASFTERVFFLYSEGSSIIVNVPQVSPFTFKNYGNAANQGNYIILSHSSYDATTNGRNYVTEYKNYRASAAGGGYNAIVVDVRELYDQFGYGQDIHPLAVKRFLKYAYDNFSVKPEYAFFIGKGLLYHKYRTYQRNTSAYSYAAIVPTYGDPGSDNNFVNFLPNRLQAIAVGRFSAWAPQEIGNYLEKVKAYESELTSATLPTHETELWKKLALHMGGGVNASQQSYLLGTLNEAAAVLRDTAFGGNITTIGKGTTNPIDIVNSKAIDSLVNNGLSLVSFNGHASSNGFDFSLKDPETYTTTARFPHFIALGCDVAQIFNLTSTLRTLSERHLLTNIGGSISILASNNLQYQEFHRLYLPTFYNSISRINYGTTIGKHQFYAYDSMRKNNPSESTYYQIESLILQGDPALSVYGVPKPDYHIASNRLSSIPANVTNTMDSFLLRVTAFNLGKAIKDTVSLKVEHINPAGTSTLIKTLQLVNLLFSDTVAFNVGINKLADIGLNKYRVTIDDNNKYDETSEANNVGTLDLFIYSDNLVPVYPKEFSIVHKPSVTLKASTLNPFRNTGRYRLEIDTTELFNSPLKQQTTITSRGGVIKWTPTISYLDSTVYYWRTSFDSAVNGNFQWSHSSFIYLANGSDGWNQSHHYQYLKNSFTGLNYGNDRTFKYPVALNQLTASNAVYKDPGSGWPWSDAAFVKV